MASVPIVLGRIVRAAFILRPDRRPCDCLARIAGDPFAPDAIASVRQPAARLPAAHGDGDGDGDGDGRKIAGPAAGPHPMMTA